MVPFSDRAFFFFLRRALSSDAACLLSLSCCRRSSDSLSSNFLARARFSFGFKLVVRVLQLLRESLVRFLEMLLGFRQFASEVAVRVFFLIELPLHLLECVFELCVCFLVVGELSSLRPVHFPVA